MGGRYGTPPARVVALHGWMRTHADFDRTLTGLDAVAPDLPGFGATAPPPAGWGSAEYAEAVAPVLEAEAAPVVLLGHSFGGRVAVCLAASHPELVSALVLSGVPLLRPEGHAVTAPSLAFRAARALHRMGILSDARMEQRRRRSGSADYQAAAGVMRDVLVRVINETSDGTYVRALRALRCPVEFVWGALDTAAPVQVARQAAEHSATASTTVLEGVGHLTPLEAPDALRDAIRRHAPSARP
jgi:pimeloyl-ACP methyl ester carboxylesterase